MIRRCRRARLREAGMNERLQTLSEEVATRRGNINQWHQELVLQIRRVKRDNLGIIFYIPPSKHML